MWHYGSRESSSGPNSYNLTTYFLPCEVSTRSSMWLITHCSVTVASFVVASFISLTVLCCCLPSCGRSVVCVVFSNSSVTNARGVNNVRHGMKVGSVCRLFWYLFYVIKRWVLGTIYTFVVEIFCIGDFPSHPEHVKQKRLIGEYVAIRGPLL